MTTMEQEAQKAMLAREILNTDNSEFLREMSKAYHRIKARMQKEDTLKQNIKEYPRQEEESCGGVVGEPAYEYGCVMENDIETDSDESIIEGIKEALRTLSEIKAGRVKTRPARELLKELEEED